MPPTRTISNRPFSKVRVSSGASNRFSTTSRVESVIALVPWRPPDGIRFPRWPSVGLRYCVTDVEKNFQVLDCATEIPVGLRNIGRLVVIVADVFSPFLDAVLCRLIHVVDARSCFQGRHPSAREFEMIRPKIEALFRICVAGDDAALTSHRFSSELIQRRVSEADDAEVAGPAPAPVAEIIEVDIR